MQLGSIALCTYVNIVCMHILLLSNIYKLYVLQWLCILHQISSIYFGVFFSLYSDLNVSLLSNTVHYGRRCCRKRSNCNYNTHTRVVLCTLEVQLYVSWLYLNGRSYTLEQFVNTALHVFTLVNLCQLLCHNPPCQPTNTCSVTALRTSGPTNHQNEHKQTGMVTTTCKTALHSDVIGAGSESSSK